MPPIVAFVRLLEKRQVTIETNVLSHHEEAPLARQTDKRFGRFDCQSTGPCWLLHNLKRTAEVQRARALLRLGDCAKIALRGSAVGSCVLVERRGTHWPSSSVPRDPTVSRNLADLASVPTEPIPLSVLTGFLGSGKTTFLSRVLAVPDLRDTAVIVSEFGAIALDHLLLEAAVDDVLELPNGCTCCAVHQGLADSFYRLLRARQAIAGRPPFRRIALETSGLADPGPVLYTLSADAFLEASLRLDRVVTTVDAVIGSETLEQYPEAAAQAAVADFLLITKTDLSPVPDALVQRLASLNTTAPIVDASDADAGAILFGGSPKALPRPRLSATVAHAHGIYALSVRLQRPMTRLGFAMALGGLARDHGEKLLRVKGVVEFADRPGGPAAIHAVQHALYPPRWLERWPDADRISRLVFVVRDLEPDEILRRFAAGEPARITSPAGGT
ncbi:MAG: GTP-binding protein [Rhodospirillales bacterium]|nr:GTP-binding protein [Rhodospirillales bacterium]